MSDRIASIRALTLYPEHAALFVAGVRDIETRSKPTRYRGKLLLHAGVRDPWSAAAQRSPRTKAALDAQGRRVEYHKLVYGAVVASCQLVDVVPIETPEFPWKERRDRTTCCLS